MCCGIAHNAIRINKILALKDGPCKNDPSPRPLPKMGEGKEIQVNLWQTIHLEN